MNLDTRLGQWSLLIALAFIWGSSFILMKRGLESFSYGQVAALRIFISSIIFLPLIIKHFRKLNRDNIKSLMVVGFIGNAIPAFLFTTAQTHIDSSFAGILNSLTPLFTLIIGVIIYKSKTRFSNILGVLVALIGAGGLIIKDTSNLLDGNNWYSLFIVCASACYGFNINEVKNKLKDLNGVAISALAFMFAGPVSGIYLMFTDISSVFASEASLQSLGYILILSLFSSVIAVIGINILIQYTTAIFAASVTYIIPIFAILWGIFDGEKILAIDILWTGVIIAGVYLVNNNFNKRLY